MTLSTNYDFQVYKQLSEKNDTIIRNVLDIEASNTDDSLEFVKAQKVYEKVQQNATSYLDLI